MAHLISIYKQLRDYCVLIQPVLTSKYGILGCTVVRRILPNHNIIDLEALNAMQHNTFFSATASSNM